MGLAAIPHLGSRIRRYPVDSAATYVEGAFVFLAADGELEEVAADGAVILGVAAHDAVLEFDPDPGFGLVFPFYPDTTMWMEGSADPVVGDVGDQFGFVHDGDGVAILDKAETTALRLTIEDVDLTRLLYEVSLIGANRQLQTTT